MRSIHFITFMILLVAGVINPAYALDQIAVRTGEHEGYSRIVFEWPQATGYKLDKSTKGKLVINFDKGANFAAAALEKDPVPNVSGVSVLSQDPLKISLNIPEQSNVRDMQAGTRLVLDIYNPPGGAQKTESLKVEQKTEAPKEEPKKEEPKPEPEKTAEVKPVEIKTEEPKPAEETKAEQPKAPEVKAKGKAAPTMVSLTSAQSFGLASFIHNGQLFVVNDKSDLLLEPHISGPLAKPMSPLTEIKSDQGKVHTLPLPQGNHVLGQGGGLIWRLMVSPDQPEAEYIVPERKIADATKERSGKIIWPLASARNIVEITDPHTGQIIKAVTVEKATALSGPARKFIDFDVLQTAVGLAIIPKVDDLEVKITKGNVEISRPGGLTLADPSLIEEEQKPIFAPKKEEEPEAEGPAAEDKTPEQELKEAIPAQRIYDFRSWQLGGVKAAADNRSILLGGMKDLSEGARIESLLTLGKMYLSNGFAPEALGVLGLAEMEMPTLVESPEFLALRGAAFVLNGDSEEGFQDLSSEALKPFEEIKYWKAAAAAYMGDWQQAAQIMPKSANIVEYTPELQNRLGLVLAEIALRSGNVALGDEFLKLIEANSKILREPQKAALNYLKGESARQQKKPADTKKLWEPLTTGSDDLYRAKAGLALTRLKVDNKELTPGKAIDNLERLRYAWRGDELEAQINSWLGRTYFESGDYIKGLKIMREATSYVPETELAKRIAGDMSDMFADLLLGPNLEKVSPLDAVALYNQFTDLVPPDARGDQMVEKLSEHLAKADLLGRAGDLLNFQLEHRLQGEEAYRTAERLAAIRLLDGEPDKAMAALNLAQQKFSELPPEMKTESRTRKLALMRARALSKQGYPDKAVTMLNDMEPQPDVNALRADIAWKAGYWDDAAEALGDVIMDQNISLTRPLDEKNTSLLLQRAIALNLASDRIALANMREKFSDVMNQTDKARIFEVITRPRQSGALADRDTLLGAVKEVDLFSDFLNSYKAMNEPAKPAPAKAPDVALPNAAAPAATPLAQ